MDTIYALASARGKAGVAIIRVSGPAAFDAVRRLCDDVPAPRHASLRRIVDGTGAVVDHALVLTFAKNASFTGEESAEFHLHGSIAIVQRVLKLLGDIGGLRLAEPGEYTRRAFVNGTMDLSQVEGLSDLIEAETEAQRVQAMRVFSGGLGDLVQSWRSDLVRAMALLEATIDFADEDVPEDVSPEVLELVTGVRDGLAGELRKSAFAERVRDGFEVAILGPANAGKSTLLNRLAGRDVALTSEIAGTTRDVIEVRMDLRGLPVTVLDTAGIRETDDTVETLGIQRALDRAARCDLRVFLVNERDDPVLSGVQTEDIVLIGKADLRNDGDISGITGKGVDALVDRIGEVLEKRFSNTGLAIRERHRVAIARSVERLDGVLGGMSAGHPIELLAEALRGTADTLSALVGKIGVEDLLDEIFASFCLGK